MSKVIAIGGTGQLVAYYYLQLYLLGVVEEAPDIVVVDTDEILKSILRIKSFLELLRTSAAQNTTAGNVKLPTITTFKIDAPEANAFEKLSGLKNTPGEHPARAFFDRESGQQSLAKGLYARPALSSVVAREQMPDGLFAPARDSATVAVGSIIGGTGGGLLAPIVDRVKALMHRMNVESRVRAVLFGQYFAPDEQQGIEAVRLQSNELLVMRTAQEALDKLDLYRIVGGPEGPRVRRLTQGEKERHVPWPEQDDHPVWEGVKALHFLLNDTVMPFRDRFEDREVTNFQPAFSMNDARQKLTRAVSMIRMAVATHLVERIAKEPFRQYIWRKDLPEILIHYWRIAKDTAGGWERVPDFPADVQSHFAALWTGQGDEWGVGDVLPRLATTHAVWPRHFTRVGWPQIVAGTTWDSKQFVSADETARRAAAVLMFFLLRKAV
ncbi:MAG: hypothetical protein QOI58_1671 [Thermoanaerobaculia bacterium]|jgi:hypothetical protein|nr:hypothetical protein [Thermoanaerobaculia bacterium]